MEPYDPTPGCKIEPQIGLLPWLFVSFVLFVCGLMFWDMQRGYIKIERNAAGEWERVR